MNLFNTNTDKATFAIHQSTQCASRQAHSVPASYLFTDPPSAAYLAGPGADLSPPSIVAVPGTAPGVEQDPDIPGYIWILVWRTLRLPRTTAGALALPCNLHPVRRSPVLPYILHFVWRPPALPRITMRTSVSIRGSAGVECSEVCVC